MTIIIGLSGRKGTGKDFGADLIQKSIAGEFGYQSVDRFAFADPMKQMLITGLGVAPEQLENRELKEMTDVYYGKSPRQMLQTLGTEWGRDCINPDIWLIAMRRKIKQSRADVILITDVRFDNEAKFIRSLGGHIFVVATTQEHAELSLDTHSSESGIEQLPRDYIIPNNFDGTYRENLKAAFGHTLLVPPSIGEITIDESITA